MVDGETSPAPQAHPARKLASLADRVSGVLAPAVPGLGFGLTELDAATGGLQPGRLTLVAAAPGAGGSLLALAAARRSALGEGRRVLYAAAGLTADDVTRWIIAAESGTDHRKLRAGALTSAEREAAEQAGARLVQAPLLVDDGADLTAEAIAESAPYVDDLALIVVDRLHHSPDPHLPLSGPRVPPAVRTLMHLARQLSVPVLAVLNTDQTHVVRSLDADVTLTLALPAGADTATVTVTERDLGQTTLLLQSDLNHARFTDAPPPSALPAPASAESALAVAEHELADAALPFTSGALKGLASRAVQILSDHRDGVLNADGKGLPGLRRHTAALARDAQLGLPSHPAAERLRAALDAFATALQQHSTERQPPTQHDDTPLGAGPGLRAQSSEAGTAVGDAGLGAPEPEDLEGQGAPELQPGDEDDEPGNAPFPALRILKEAISRSKMHPIAVISKDERDEAPWALFNEVMDGEPRWVHPDVDSVRIRGGKRHQLIVPDRFGPGQLCTIDRNGSYPSACSAVTLAPNKLKQTGPLEQRAKDQAGIFQIDVPVWKHAHMPHPLGRLAMRPDAQGRIWVTTPHMEILEKLIRQGHLTEPLRIYDSWTGRANNSLLKPFYQAAKTARAELIGTGEAYIEYKRRLSIALRLLWPKGESVNSPFWRPDWRMSMVAEASVRHWVMAWGAVQDGHTLIALRNVDEAVFWTPDGIAPGKYKVGTGFGEVKVKVEQGGED
ncbi:DnaB-like helicase C-terminal domain-containing protein [Streptomyces sp. NPDC058308]|uniref:DnaB-like helicase C-terminal domain-containing protein n=1 Tax=Streptomyces sp. NPDC058308 TaxID=3346440 RepID=UPI0036E44959